MKLKLDLKLNFGRVEFANVKCVKCFVFVLLFLFCLFCLFCYGSQGGVPHQLAWGGSQGRVAKSVGSLLSSARDDGQRRAYVAICGICAV